MTLYLLRVQSTVVNSASQKWSVPGRLKIEVRIRIRIRIRIGVRIRVRFRVCTSEAEDRSPLVNLVNLTPDSSILTGGGSVAALEVSVDAGQSWHPVSIPIRPRVQFSYSLVLNEGITQLSMASWPREVLSRAADDSGNLEEAVLIS